LVDETLHIVVLAEHKRVNRNALARTALHLFERLQQGALGRGVFETDLAVPDMCGRLAIRNQNYLFVGGMLTRQELRGYLESGLDVGKRLRYVNPAGDSVRRFDL